MVIAPAWCTAWQYMHVMNVSGGHVAEIIVHKARTLALVIHSGRLSTPLVVVSDRLEECLTICTAIP